MMNGRVTEWNKMDRKKEMNTSYNIRYKTLVSCRKGQPKDQEKVEIYYYIYHSIRRGEEKTDVKLLHILNRNLQLSKAKIMNG